MPSVLIVDEAGSPIKQSNPLSTRLAGKTNLIHTAVSVTTNSQKILDANDNRKYVLFVNDSDSIMYLKIGNNAVLNEGIRLNAGGGSFEMSAGLGNLDTRAIYAIHGGTGDKKILITEGV